jgi:hypothetical protein
VNVVGTVFLVEELTSWPGRGLTEEPHIGTEPALQHVNIDRVTSTFGPKFGMVGTSNMIGIRVNCGYLLLAR